MLSDGISRQTPITIGQATEITGLVMLLVSWAVGIPPGIGTVMNMILVGFFVDSFSVPASSTRRAPTRFGS